MLRGHPLAELVFLVGHLVLCRVCVHSRPPHGPWCEMIEYVLTEIILLIVVVVSVVGSSK